MHSEPCYCMRHGANWTVTQLTNGSPITFDIPDDKVQANFYECKFARVSGEYLEVYGEDESLVKLIDSGETLRDIRYPDNFVDDPHSRVTFIYQDKTLSAKSGEFRDSARPTQLESHN